MMGRKKSHRALDGEYYNRRFEEVDSKQNSYYKYADDTEDAIARVETFWKECVCHHTMIFMLMQLQILFAG